LAETNNFIIVFQFYNTTGSSLKKVGGRKVMPIKQSVDVQ